MRIETVAYQLEWKKFRRGYSFFVPCIDGKAAREELHRVAKRLKFKIATKIVLLEGIKGLRVWRI
jgi:hypothetical protein